MLQVCWIICLTQTNALCIKDHMTKEFSDRPNPKRPYEIYGFTEKKRLYWRINQERFDEIIKDERTFVHDIKDSSNNYGDFLFVTTSRSGDQGRICMTFFGLGFHEYRERWITDEWFWFQTNVYPNLIRQTINKAKTEELIKQRRESILPQVRSDIQTNRGKLFEMLADLTDEDGALAEIQDLGDDWEYLLGNFDT